jgi:hypothetical protein
MKLLGLIFLAIGLVVAMRGGLKTNADSLLAFEEDLAEKAIEQSREQVKFLVAATTGKREHVFQVSDTKMRNELIDHLNKKGRIDVLETAPLIVVAERDIKNAEAKYEKAKVDRIETMRWHYVPAGCLAVIGLILMVVPTPPKREAVQAAVS